MKKNIAFAALRKVFSAAVFAGCVCLNVQAVTLDDFDISGKPVTTPTLDYLRSNHVEIPQKQISGGVLVDGGTPIEAPESAYTISVGSESDYSFMIYTEDETGALVAKYYKVNIDTPQASGGLSWTETASAGPNTVKVSLPNGDRYFAYSYVTPAGYIENTRGGGALRFCQ